MFNRRRNWLLTMLVTMSVITALRGSGARGSRAKVADNRTQQAAINSWPWAISACSITAETRGGDVKNYVASSGRRFDALITAGDNVYVQPKDVNDRSGDSFSKR